MYPNERTCNQPRLLCQHQRSGQAPAVAAAPLCMHVCSTRAGSDDATCASADMQCPGQSCWVQGKAWGLGTTLPACVDSPRWSDLGVAEAGKWAATPVKGRLDAHWVRCQGIQDAGRCLPMRALCALTCGPATPFLWKACCRGTCLCFAFSSNSSISAARSSPSKGHGAMATAALYCFRPPLVALDRPCGFAGA